MRDLRSVKTLTGYTVHAADGNIGKVKELYFDDADWRVKYIVVDPKPRLPGGKVLIAASDVKDILWKQRELLVAVTLEQVRNNPDLATDKSFEPHLRSTKVITGFTLQAKDGAAGRIADFIFDAESWAICYVAIALAHGKRVLFPSQLVKDILVEKSLIVSDLQMRVINDGPTIDPSISLTDKYEKAIIRHYLIAAQPAAPAPGSSSN